MGKRKCSTCKTPKPVAEFDYRNKAKNILQWSCRECSNKRAREHYRKNKEQYKIRKANRRKEKQKWILEHLNNNPCKCGESNPAALDFDHDRDKKFAISKGISNGVSLETLIEEVAKCTVRCANCHRKKTAEEQNWYK